jgi:hypothetical protein
MVATNIFTLLQPLRMLAAINLDNKVSLREVKINPLIIGF